MRWQGRRRSGEVQRPEECDRGGALPWTQRSSAGWIASGGKHRSR